MSLSPLSSSQDELENQRLKRGHVLAELLETERIYVAEMGAILKVSKHEFPPTVTSHLFGGGLRWGRLKNSKKRSTSIIDFHNL